MAFPFSHHSTLDSVIQDTLVLFVKKYSECQPFSTLASIWYSHLPDALRSSWVNPLVLLQELWRIAEVSSLLDRFHAT